ncbi:MAG: EscU/YscU/HrcU family type III secretion system export apparatus switch protein [Deltaproteobacteria bacterium]|nr:EscU/YscU/HrcU family type III secretion system export apparatus switch protein [Deltaproteobacteria bacterium]MBW2123439.1 EscU/YscU/HrcU family type III secretion system export apparatus switch protein [Deltaproteobacteria bacterium]
MRRVRNRAIREALALDYRPGEGEVPRVVAKGKGVVAERIIGAARKAGVPIREDPALLSLLSTLDLDEEIPPEAYAVVAEILAFVYRVHHRWKAGLAGGPR